MPIKAQKKETRTPVLDRHWTDSIKIAYYAVEVTDPVILKFRQGGDPSTLPNTN
jgi:hypothetical protein